MRDVSQADYDRCQRFAKALVADLHRSKTRDLSRSTATWFDVTAQTNAKVGEVAFCLWAGLDPDTAIDWTVKRPDPGHDVIMACGWRWDVKQTNTGRLIIWPSNKVDLFPKKEFDFMVVVRGTFHLPGGVAPYRWCHRREFEFFHEVADARNYPLLSPGTMVLPARLAHEMSEF